MGHWEKCTKYRELFSLETLKVFFMFLSYTVCVFVGISFFFLFWTMCVCVVLCIMSIQAPCVFVCVCEYRLCERWGDVHSFVPAGSLSRRGSTDLYWRNNSGSRTLAQGEDYCFQFLHMLELFL